MVLVVDIMKLAIYYYENTYIFVEEKIFLMSYSNRNSMGIQPLILRNKVEIAIVINVECFDPECVNTYTLRQK